MSAPRTNIERQKRRHFGPLLGLIVSIGVVAVLFMGYLFYIAESAPTPETPAAGPSSGVGTPGG
ncbi:MAG: hypothetical protein HC844_16725 [Tabrizicola sp.]|nr:hypothetical protein [Tabrizicola sp.]